MPPRYGGFETFVNQFLDHVNADIDVTLIVGKERQRQQRYKSVNQVYTPFGANGLQSIFNDMYALCYAWFYGIFHRKIDIRILLLGCSGGFALIILQLMKRKNLKIVVNIAGQEWKRSKWGFLARKVLKILESVCVRYCDDVVVDNRGLQDYVLSEYDIIAKFIPYGADHATVGSKVQNLTRITGVNFNYDLAIGRCQPDNNLEMILDAYVITQRNIVYISNWESSNFGKAIKVKYANYKNIQLLGPYYDDFIIARYRQFCSLYIHGHSAGGTNPTLIEIMEYEKRILCFDNVFNRYTTDGRGGFFKNSNQLVKLLENVGELEFVKNEGDQYTWASVSKKYLEVLFDA